MLSRVPICSLCERELAALDRVWEARPSGPDRAVQYWCFCRPCWAELSRSRREGLRAVDARMLRNPPPNGDPYTIRFTALSGSVMGFEVQNAQVFSLPNRDRLWRLGGSRFWVLDPLRGDARQIDPEEARRLLENPPGEPEPAPGRREIALEAGLELE
jgi:hypothetical protein